MQKIDYSQLELNPFTMIGNEAFLLTAGTMKDWNTITAGWGGLGFIWGEPSVFLFVRESRYKLSFMDKYEIHAFLLPSGDEESSRFLRFSLRSRHR